MDMIVPPANLAAELDTTDTEIQSQDGIKSCNVESSNLNSSEDANKMETEDVEENVCPKENDKNQETEPKSSNEETEETINSVENTSSVEDNRTIDDSVNVTPTDDQSNTKSTIDSVDHISNSVSENNQVCETTEIPQQAEIEKSIEENLHSPNPLDTEVTTNETVSEDKPIEIGEISNKELKAQPVEEPMEVDSEIHDSLSEKEEEALPVAEIIPTEPKKYLHEDNISTNDTNEVEKDTNETEGNVNKLNNTENTSDQSQNNEIMNIEENSLSMETENVSEKCEENETLKIDTLKNDPFESLKSGFTDNESTDISKTHSSSEISMSIDLEKEKVPSAETSTEDLPDSEDMQQTNDVLSETEDQDIEQENPVFVHVNTKGDGESEGDKTLSSDVDQSDAGDESLEASCLTEEDPIGITQEAEKDELMDYTEDTTEKEQLKVVDINEAITSDKSSIDDELTASKGADEELCIIPDTEREISQEEKDAARAAAAAAAEAAEKTLADAAPTETTETVKDVEESEKSETAASSSDSKDVEKSGDKLADNVTDEKTTSNEIDATSQDTDVNNENSEVLKRPNDIKITEIPESEQTEETCQQCCNQRKSVFRVESQEKPIYLCSQTCVVSFRTLNKSIPEQVKPKSGIQLKDIAKTMAGTPSTPETNKMYVRKCSECSLPINASEEKVLSWETMDFCNEDCLSKYQNTIGSHCANCKNEVLMSSLGKYCVRFGHDIRQFCCSSCLEEFKKGLKVCSYCQKDISGGQEGFLAPVGDKGQFKDFCTQLCMDKYEQMSNKNSVKKTSPELALCFVCNEDKPVNLMFEQFELKNKFCGEPCFIAYKYVNNVDPLQCEMCKNYFENENSTKFSIFYDNMVKNFCSKTCQNIYIIANRRIVPCSWCKVKKYNFDMIRKVCSNGQVLMMCSLNCLSLFQVSISAVSTKRMKCDHCAKISQAQYHLTMSDATIRNFCAYPCVMAFQNQFSKVPITLNTPAPAVSSDKPSTIINTRSNAVPAGGPKRYSNRTTRSVSNDTSEVQMPVITNVQSLASPVTNGPTQSATVTRSTAHKINNQQQSTPQPPSQPVVNYKQHVIVKAPPMPEMKNAVTLCKPLMHTKGVSCRPHPCSKETQTDEIKEKTVLVPVPVPIYVPAPAQMYSAPVPVPIPFPIPIPVPIFIPTTRNSAAGIMKEIKKIQVKIPTDPFEAELLMMAEMVAGEKKVDNTDSESEEDDTADTGNDGGFSPEAVDTSNTFGDDMLQMALKMATELDEPAVDLEGALTANTITASQNQDQTGVVQNEEAVDDPQPMHQLMDRGQPMRGRKRPNRQPRNMNAAKRGRRMSQHVEMPLLPPPPPQQPPEPIEKPDANMCLKYTFGVNAWKQWVTTKNAELEKSSRRVKLFKNEILQLTADELNYSLCLFVKEVRKPNGTEYAPDTIYYLCLGIQQYLFENGRIDNIFTDAYYEKFTDCLDEVARKFSVLYNDSHYIVTRVEEEHLWESKQLGAHSPHVLLSTLMFFNTKHFNLTTVDEHMQLSFSHIMKHWKRNPNQPGAAKIPGSRNVLLRFYPPQTTLDSNSRKKKVYEQQENEENPLRCPVKLYEFYLSKCPESVKTRNDVFYLLPERSCVPDSPVWYSTMALGREALEKMLHRVKMVKEINVALLTMD